MTTARAGLPLSGYNRLAMQRRFALVIATAIALPACSSSEQVEVQFTTSTHNGEWVGTIAGTSLLEWQLTETPNGGGALVSGTGTIRAIGCTTPIRIAGDRTGDDSFLTVTIDALPDFEMSVVGSFVGERYQAIYSLDSGVAPPDCIPELGGVVRVGERNDAGLNGPFFGSWAITPSFSDTVAPYGEMHLVQTANDVFGTVEWFGGYPCAARGFLSGTFDGQEFLANVFSQNPNDAYHLLEAALDPDAGLFAGLSTLLSAGPSPACPLLGETSFWMHALTTLEATDDPRTSVRPIGFVRRIGTQGEPLETGVLFRATELAD